MNFGSYNFGFYEKKFHFKRTIDACGLAGTWEPDPLEREST